MSLKYGLYLPQGFVHELAGIKNPLEMLDHEEEEPDTKDGRVDFFHSSASMYRTAVPRSLSSAGFWPTTVWCRRSTVGIRRMPMGYTWMETRSRRCLNDCISVCQRHGSTTS